ncbi:Hpt domain-containing protein [uncultured Thiohalocapsa sp.]|uniref:Hpt domain-containing protein n=1 Tax=uncultured Thiohalocapsa sp. TaxID=768990 RepID=UPI0025DC2038|nr:Hpt domain-containing protein [uncultured Thiohalocapsa sp.]
MQQPDSTDELPVWDQAAAVRSVGDLGLARRLLAQLCAGLPDDLAALRRLHAAGELTELAERAHHVSGGAAYCGVTALRASLKTLEQRARAGDAADSAAALQALAVQIERLLAHLRALD